MERVIDWALATIAFIAVAILIMLAGAAWTLKPVPPVPNQSQVRLSVVEPLDYHRAHEAYILEASK